MDFVRCYGKSDKNSRAVFRLRLETPCDTLRLYAADTYQVFFDGALVSYGPERTAAGFARKREIPIKDTHLVEIKLLSFNVPCYECDLQESFIGIEVALGDEIIYGTKDFTAVRELSRIVKMPRYSGQRGFTEGYDLTAFGEEELCMTDLTPPTLLDGAPDRCDYREYSFTYDGRRVFKGFEEVVTPWLYSNPLAAPAPDDFSVEELIGRLAAGSAKEHNFHLENEKTGFISLDIWASEACEVAVVFDEIAPMGKWIFRRGACNDIVYLRLPAGRHKVLTAEPYALKLLKVISSAPITLRPSLIGYENNRAECLRVSGDERIVGVIEAAKSSFMQNAVDVFTDCPSRERAGWLCDSYFTAKAELLFSGKNVIEKSFLESIILAKTEELPEGMLPMCFPSQHPKGRYIPNWAMWFILELKDYLERTGDRELIDRAREKAFGVISFFDRFLNSDGLLEDLESWVFIEWSICNDDEFVKGVNYPSNMLYAKMLEDASELYGVPSLAERADRIRRTIREQSFNGEFFCDNAIRENGLLKRCDEHISETCQYYALFMGIECDDDFKKKIAEQFGPLRPKEHRPEIGRSNMFIGNYLRFIWLNSIGEEARVAEECLSYFSDMTSLTGTLWEHDSPRASCNHGFASCIAVILLRALVGYVGTKNGKPEFIPGYKFKENIDFKTEFNY